MGRKKLTASQKARKDWLRRNVNFLVNMELGGTKRLCKKSKKKKECASYRKMIRTRRANAVKRKAGKIFTKKQWDRMLREANYRAWVKLGRPKSR